MAPGSLKTALARPRVLKSILKKKTVNSRKGFEFDKLPTELRKMIWKELATEPRVVEIYITDAPYGGEPNLTFKSKNIVPVCLRVNHESRQVALKHYQLSFACPMDFINKRLPTIYFNFSHDVAYFKVVKYFDDYDNTKFSLDSLPYLVGSISRPLNGKEIRIVAFPVKQAASNSLQFSVSFLSQLPKLSEIILVGNEVEAKDLREETDSVVHRSGRSFARRNLNIMDAGNFAQPKWINKAEELRRQFVKLKNKDLMKKIPQPTVSVKIFVRED